MRRGTIVVVLFILIVGAIVAAGLLLPEPPPPDPIVAEIVANPLAQAWLTEAVMTFNAAGQKIAGRPIQITITYIDDLAVWQTTQWTTSNHPDGWIPAINASLDYAGGVYTSFSLEVVQASTAQTLLVWGGYRERVNLLTPDFSWQTVAAAAQQGTWAAVAGDSSISAFERVNLAFPPPNSRITGLAVLFSGLAHLDGGADLNAVPTSSRDALLPVVCRVPNFNAVGEDPAARMATNRSLADIGLLPENQWLRSLSRLGGSDAFVLAYPTRPFVFNFPLVAVSLRGEAASLERQAVAAFGDFLLSAEQQRAVMDVGLRPVAGLPMVEGQLDPAATLFVNAQNAGLIAELDLSDPVQPPNRTGVLSLLNWFSARNCS